MRFRALVGQQNDVTDDGYSRRDDDEQSSASEALRKNGPKDCEDGGHSIHRNREQLGVSSCVAHIFDNCWLQYR